MNSIDDGLEGNGSKANPIVGQIVLADQLIGVAAEGGLDSEVEVGPTAAGNATGAMAGGGLSCADQA